VPELNEWGVFALGTLAVLVAAVIGVAIVVIPLRLIARRRGWDPSLLGRMRRPFRVLVLLVALSVAVRLWLPSDFADWRAQILHALAILMIGAGAWLLSGIVGVLFARVLASYRTDVSDNRVARRVHTQVSILRRVIYVVIAILAVGAILLTFPEVQTVGASLLASAGVLSVVAGIAAQGTLANVFAGLQLAFSDAIRVDDVVIADGEWGRIEEITLTYVVVHIWDDRRLVLPSTYFTTTPFQNWTRRGSELLGSIELDLDWTVSPGEMREHLAAVLQADPLWDRRSSSLQITDATGGHVRVRIVVTASSAGALWDLRCNVREAMVEWLHEKHQEALPRTRVSMIEQGAAPRPRADRGAPHEGVFSGSADAERRGQSFTQSTPIQRPADTKPIPTDLPRQGESTSDRSR
jgi:small-conductance mechanosensitive channel